MLDVISREELLDCERGNGKPVLATEKLSVTVGRRLLLRAVDLRIEPRRVLGILGPSGAGKTTLLRCLNRLSDLVPELTVSGDVRLHGESIYGRAVDVDALRSRIGMIFQQPVVFPGSIADNVLFGVRRTRRLPRRDWPGRVERALREAALWGEVHHRLREPAGRLSVGQQQRLCLARVLACEPEILLLDEPTSALDERSTREIEELILRLRERHAIVLVTHNLQQARRVADSVACLGVRDHAGELVESGRCCDVFPGSRDERP